MLVKGATAVVVTEVKLLIDNYTAHRTLAVIPLRKLFIIPQEPIEAAANVMAWYKHVVPYLPTEQLSVLRWCFFTDLTGFNVCDLFHMWTTFGNQVIEYYHIHSGKPFALTTILALVTGYHPIHSSKMFDSYLVIWWRIYVTALKPWLKNNEYIILLGILLIDILPLLSILPLVCPYLYHEIMESNLL